MVHVFENMSVVTFAKGFLGLIVSVDRETPGRPANKETCLFAN